MTLERDFENHMRRVLESGHTTRDGANAPPADTWQRVLARIQPPNEEEKTMNTATFATPMNMPTSIPAASHRSMSRYLNLAATVALVLTIALGGWLAAIRMNQPGHPDPRFAVLPGTPLVDQGQTCDVEPLSVDRVMEIVKNPIPYLQNGPASEPEYISVVLPTSAELFEGNYSFDMFRATSTPNREQFSEAEQVVDNYLACLLGGTQGQLWTFYTPTAIQTNVLAEFPVFADEDEVRSRVEERINDPALGSEYIWRTLPGFDGVVSGVANPDRDLSLLFTTNSLYFQEVVQVGVMLQDSDGKAIIQTNGSGMSLVPLDPMIMNRNDFRIMVTLVKPIDSEVWLVQPNPSPAELGLPPE